MTAYRSPWLDDELESFRGTVRRFVTDELAPREPAWQQAHRVDAASWREVGAMGLLLCDVPEAYGGSGGTFAHDCVVFEELAYAGVMSFGKHVHNICAHYVMAYGTEAQKRRWLPGLASGERSAPSRCPSRPPGRTCRASAPARSAAATTTSSTARRRSSRTGRSRTSSASSSRPTPAPAPRASRSSWSRPTASPDSAAAARWTRSGSRDRTPPSSSSTTAACRPTRCWAAPRAPGFAQLMEQLPYERTLVALTGVAVIERAVRLTTEYARERKAFGKTLLEMQNTRFKLAEAKTIAHVGRVFIDSCIERYLAGTLDTATASMAKWWLTDMQCQVIDECLQLFGGYGYMREYPIAQMYADARVQRIYGGTNEIMKEIIARTL